MERKGLRRWMYPLCSHKSNQSGREGGRAQPLKEWHRLCCPVMSSSLQPHGLQHARPLCPSPSHKVYPSSCPLHRWCHSIISSSDTLFSCPQSFPSSGTFPMSRLFASDDQNTGFSFSISPSNEYSELISLKIDWFDLFAVQETARSLLEHHS